LPAQSRGARGLIQWSQTQLAKKAGVSLSTVADFENGRRLPIPNNLAAIRKALEVAAQGCDYGSSKMPPTHPTSSVITEQLTRALGEAVIRIWSNLPQDVQNHLRNSSVTVGPHSAIRD
jgi:transcriptional regulator with XRE-family HTH domain